MPTGIGVQGRTGQSIVELVVVLALVAIVAISILVGIGRESTTQMQHVNDALGGKTPATAGGGEEDGGGGGKPDDDSRK